MPRPPGTGSRLNSRRSRAAIWTTPSLSASLATARKRMNWSHTTPISLPADVRHTARPAPRLVSHIPARRLVFFLDCCFSGGFGSKVLQVDLKPRNLRSAESKLARIAGDGRIAGRISVYRLLDHVTARVSAVAAQFGLQQHPTMRGKDRRRRALADLCRGPALRGGVPPSPTRRRHGRPDEPPERGLPSSTDRGVVERNPLAERTSGRRSEVQLRDKPESQNPPPRRPRRQRKPERIGR
jgi:hypothetical protein